jgi:hypothetical protein
MAISPQSRLYARLQQEKAMYILMVHSFDCCFKVMSEYEEPEDADEETLEILMNGYSDVFKSKVETRQLVDDFQAEVERTQIKVAYFESSSVEIEKRLTQELNRRQSSDVAFLSSLLFGDRDFAPHWFPGVRQDLNLVSLPIVQQGARILSGIKLHSLFNVDEDAEDWNWDDPDIEDAFEGWWYARQFWYWKRLYLEAAAAREEILVGIN